MSGRGGGVTDVAGGLALHAKHQELGAHFVEQGGRLVPRHYGDPAAEYAAMTEGLGVVDRSERALVRLSGRDPVKMIQGLVTSDVAGAPYGQGTYGVVLTAKGKMVADVRAFRLGSGEVILDAEGLARDGLLDHLRRFVPPLFARHEEVSGATGVLGVFGPRAREAVEVVLSSAIPEAMPEEGFVVAPFTGGDVLATYTRFAGVDGYDLIASHDALEPLWAALVSEGARPAGHGALEVLRIEAGRPRWGNDLDEGVIPLEAGLRERAISETKGCYTGQEVIVRILHRGHVNRHLRRLFLGDAPALPKGSPLVRPGESKAVGSVTSACNSPRFGQTIGLGYVRREVEPPATLRLGDAEDVEVEVAALS